MFFNRFQRDWFFFAIIIITVFNSANCIPIDVTGKNISFYNLTPNEGSGNYNFNYGTRDGAMRSERGFVKKEPGSDKPLLVVTGTFQYPDSDGELHEVAYIADEQGYRIVDKEEVEKLHNELPNEILPTQKSVEGAKSTSSSSPTSTTAPLYSVSFLVSSSLPPTPRPAATTETAIIKLKVKPADKQIVCPPGRCSGLRQSKIYKIKTLKIT